MIRWLPWFLAVALLAAVVGAALRFAEAREFVRLAEESEPWWLVLALGLQATTYMAQGEVLRCVGRAGNFRLRLATVYKLSLAKLFMDQALPSAGLSGTFLVANALERHGMPRALIATSVVIDLASHYAAYVVVLTAALLCAAGRGQASPGILAASVLFACYGVAVSAAILTLSERGVPAWLLRVAHFRALRLGLRFLEEAQPGLARNPRLLLQTSGCQLAIFLCDAATMWVLIRSLGTSGSISGVFTSFMISTLFRSVGALPSGLGSFEAASMLTLKMEGVPIAVALSATLLFRGLSFWLPMLPGFWYSRRLTDQPAHESR